MNGPSRTHVIAAGVIACLAAPALLAQSEKISIRMVPVPGQTVHMTMNQDMDMDISFDGNQAAPAVAGPMKVLITTTLAMTQKTGAVKPDGTLDAEITYDQIRTEMTMNGQTMPAEADTQLVGKPVVVTYNRSGEIVDVKGLPAAGLTTESFKQMMNSFYGNLPVTAIGVGEETSAPLDFSMPLPLPGGAPMKLVGQTRLKLVSIDKDAKGRSARFDSTVTGTMDMAIPSPDGTAGMSVDFTMTGTGTSVMDLEKRLLRSSESTATIDGKLKTAGGRGPAPLPGMSMRATIRVTIASN